LPLPINYLVNRTVEDGFDFFLGTIFGNQPRWAQRVPEADRTLFFSRVVGRLRALGCSRFEDSEIIAAADAVICELGD
jgi:hypothetical protein